MKILNLKIFKSTCNDCGKWTKLIVCEPCGTPLCKKHLKRHVKKCRWQPSDKIQKI